ncbi:hypothetical protein PsorP6_010386 [Peronosclerospora sorghi]|uniref:Uncharacterized protein n=1 Tax=Peronosclerospora sorghi TaxID=230839 RepID=A0ACC0VXT4_9STRA|nr:hypothetical protein PsorP6_010386 [Peronosclerospora sorghi]
MKTHRFTMNPFRELKLTPDARAKLVEITDAIILETFEEYEEHLAKCKRVDLHRWKKIDKSGPLTSYMERKCSNPNSKLPNMQMVGALPGSLDENMFGIVNPTIEAMRIKTSYLKDFSAAALLGLHCQDRTSRHCFDPLSMFFFSPSPLYLHLCCAPWFLPGLLCTSLVRPRRAEPTAQFPH